MADERQITRWVLRAQVRDTEAFDQLLREIQHPLYRCIAGIVRDEALAEDVLQEVLVSIYRKLKRLRDPSLFRPWAYRIATRRAMKELRRELRRKSHSWDPTALSRMAADLGPPPQMESAEAVETLLKQVAPASRAILALHYVQGLSLQETADVLGLAVGTVKSRLSNALNALRRHASRTASHLPGDET